MTPNDYIEAEGATVEQAIREALAALGAEEADVSIQILTTPRSGLLGLGVRQARVRVTRRTPETARSEVASPPAVPKREQAGAASAAKSEVPAAAHQEAGVNGESLPRAEAAAVTPARARHPGQEAEPGLEEDLQEGGPERHTSSLDDQCQEALRMVGEILELMGERAEAVLNASDPDSIHIDIKGDGSGILIGRHGQTLDALEYLINRLVARHIKDAAPVTLDVAAYRARRRQQLERMALAMGERAKRERKTVALEPMPPRDRRIVHLTLKDDPLIATRSLGGGYMRALEIVPTEVNRESGERDAPRRRQPRETPGQQGGFKHGQKRIV